MVTRVERRDYEIEKMRKNFLEYYFDENKHDIDSDSMQALGLNMYAADLTPKKLLYNAFCKSFYDSKIVMHPQQV